MMLFKTNRGPRYMAANAVHQSSVEHSRPTIFELSAQNSLVNALKSAVLSIASSLTSRLPYGSPLFKTEEFYAVVNLALQSLYIFRFGASFSEAFYGLKRQRLDSSGSLSLREKLLSLASLVGGPYVLAKLGQHVDKVSSRGDDSTTVRAIKTFTTAYYLSDLVYFIRYIAGLSTSPSLLTRLSNVQLVNSSERDNERSVALKALEFAAFLIQFLNWWETSGKRSQVNLVGAPTPEAPHRRLAATSPPAGMCPLCLRRPWRVPVVLPSNGVIYCYPCIAQKISHADANSLVRLYLDT